MDTISLVLIQILIIIGLSRLMGLACRLIKQPLVIGEIIAGIILGPSLLGLVAPELLTTLFPQNTLPFLNLLSQIGLIFFMFLIGLELNPKYLKGNFNTAVLISHVSIILPFSLGCILALLLYPLLSNNEVSFAAFALFLGSAMSITAFPVLARIITENNLQKTKLGTLALTCAAVDDVTAWCLLALAIAVTRTNSIVDAFPTIIEAFIYIAFMLTAGRWLLEKLLKYYQQTQKLSQLVLAMIYVGLLISALTTQLIGIHFIFGSFLMGAAMPKYPALVRDIAEKTEDFVLIFLLPIFFAYSGLNTEIGLLNQPLLWLLCALVVTVAIVGKYFGTYISARASGINNQQASALGWLMNTRGLTELIVLNIGLSFGVISPLLFTMLVIMALVTTCMTSPLLEWIYPKEKIKLNLADDESPDFISPAAPETAKTEYRVLVPIANPDAQFNLLQLAMEIAGNSSAAVHPLFLLDSVADYAFHNTPQETDILLKEQHNNIVALIKELQPSHLRNIVHPFVRVAHDVARETAKIAIADRADLVLVGWHRPAFSDNRLGGRVGKILNTSPVDVAVFIDKQPLKLDSILVAYSENNHDDLGLSLALRLLLHDPGRKVKVLRFYHEDLDEYNNISNEFKNMIDLLPPLVQSRIEVLRLTDSEPIEKVILASQDVDLTIAGTSRTWGIERQTLGFYTDRLAQECHSSLLITRRYSSVSSHIQSLL
ncbi:MAG: Glutathione-regulated potassium-efflux system protein KefB [Chroococcopsis gigantea SAG 12.99]|jgi:Kef-type K+ transport system membrane component KefB/nucleotide-binding universal stress UspA family protein|nr:cation:proton antiporter [Chlorogloea purpurea SAG 13.99]MDV2999625.1 Glutathione-regulated potassium-efflux system protein KefB [Chroococcopsis gigantea SAG 12.99]